MRRNISVVGLGYIGLPLALSYCEKGYRVFGIDIDAHKVDRLLQGETDVQEFHEGLPLQQILQKHLATGMFVPSTRMAVAAWEANVYLVTVGIPVKGHGQTDEGPLLSAMEQLGLVIKQNDLIILRSTIVPGMVEYQILPLLERISRMRAGIDFHFAYASERVAEGRAMREFQTLDIVMGGVTTQCRQMAKEVLSGLTSGIIHETDLRTAQAVKVIENAQRDVNIALAQEIAQFAKQHEIDVYELIKMANTHPRVHLLEPGIGVGGYCIPNAYHYMKASVERPQEVLRIFDWARQTNDSIPYRIVADVSEKLELKRKYLHESTVAILGLGMKDNSNDVRQSPAVAVAEILMQRGACVRAYDPLVPIGEIEYQAKTLQEALYEADALIIAVWHREFETLDIGTALGQSHVGDSIIDLKNRLAAYRVSFPAGNGNAITSGA